MMRRQSGYASDDAGTKASRRAPARERLALSVCGSDVFIGLFAVPAAAAALSLLIGLYQPEAAPTGGAAMDTLAAALVAAEHAPPPGAGRASRAPDAAAAPAPSVVERAPLALELPDQELPDMELPDMELSALGLPKQLDAPSAPVADPLSVGALPRPRLSPDMISASPAPAPRIISDPDRLEPPRLTALAAPAAPRAPRGADAPPALDAAARVSDARDRGLASVPWPRVRADAASMGSLDLGADSPAAPEALGLVDVLLYYGPGTSEAEARRIAENVAELGFETVERRRVRFRIRSSSVRYFFDSDRAAARRLHLEALAGLADAAEGPQDFTLYRPSPKPGALALWLAD